MLQKWQTRNTLLNMLSKRAHVVVILLLKLKKTSEHTVNLKKCHTAENLCRMEKKKTDKLICVQKSSYLFPVMPKIHEICLFSIYKETLLTLISFYFLRKILKWKENISYLVAPVETTRTDFFLICHAIKARTCSIYAKGSARYHQC